MENVTYHAYTYEAYMVVMSVNICLIGSYTTFNLLQNVRYMRDLKKRIILLFIAAFSLSILTIWSPHFLMISAVKFSKIQILIDIKMTFTSMGVAIICNTIGFSICFIPFLCQIEFEYEAFIKQNPKVFLTTSEVKLSEEDNTNYINNITKLRNLTNVHNVRIANNIDIHDRKYISKSKTLNHNKLNLDRTIRSGKDVHFDFQKYEKHDFNNYEFSSFFKNRKLTKKDFILIFLGGILFLSPSIMFLHIIGIKAMVFEGKINFNTNLQIIISFIGLIGMTVLNMSLFLEDSLKNKLIFSLGFSASVLGLHCLSFHFLSFYTETDDTTDYSYLYKDSNLVTINQCSKIVLVINGFLAYVVREISNFFNKNSWKEIKEFNISLSQNNFPTFLIESMFVSILRNKSSENLKNSVKNLESH
jgi:NO-binding membrane sensor protein with MHYT domain